MTTMPSRSVLLEIARSRELNSSGAHPLHGVIDQVEHHLLELDTVSFETRQPFAQPASARLLLSRRCRDKRIMRRILVARRATQSAGRVRPPRFRARNFPT